MNRKLLLLIVTTLFFPVVLFSVENPWEILETDLDRAEQLLRESDTAEGRFEYGLFLYAFRNNKENESTIQTIFNDTQKIAMDILAKRGSSPSSYFDSSYELPYDGTDASVIRLLRTVSVSSGCSIPFSILKRKPALLEALSTYFGSSVDNFLPYCKGQPKNYPEKEVNQYLKVAMQYGTGNYLKLREGTIVYAHTRGQMWSEIQLQLDPKRFLPYQHATFAPFGTWAYASLYNYEKQNVIAKAFERAKEAVSIYYQSDFHMNVPDSEKAAHSALLQLVWGADCPVILEDSIRKRILDGQNTNEIKRFIQSGLYKDPRYIEPFFDLYSGHSGIEPLVHIAIKDCETLRFLWDWSRSLPFSKEEKIRLDLNLDSNAKNEFNKTPLMTAAQYNLIESAQFLLEKNAEVNARTEAPSYESLEHDQRTALMYAAANSSLAFIKLLVNNHADIELTDSKGKTALDYLQGNGPVPRNPLLNEADFAQACQLLKQSHAETFSAFHSVSPTG